MFGIDDLAFATLASGALGAGSNILGGFMSQKGAQSANALQYQMFQEQNAFQERMYKNRYTYAVEDLRRAKLNPLLAINSAGSAPMGASPVMMQNTGEGMARSFGSSASYLADMVKGVVKKSNADATVSNAEAVIAEKTLPKRIDLENAKLDAEIYEANSAKDVWGRIAHRIGQYSGALGNVFKHLGGIGKQPPTTVIYNSKGGKK